MPGDTGAGTFRSGRSAVARIWLGLALVVGVALLANLVFLPIANKIKALVARDVSMREMLIEGLVGIANGENPRSIEIRLQGYLV